MARSNGEWVYKFSLSFINHLTAADKIAEIAVGKDWHHWSKRDLGLLCFSTLRFGTGVLAAGLAAGTATNIVENLLR